MLRIDPEHLLRALVHPPTHRAPPADVMELSGLIRWLETKDPHERYEYTAGSPRLMCKGCMCFQYFQENGINIAHVDARRFYTTVNDDVGIRYPASFNQVAYGGCFGDNTFGDALDRARQLAQGYRSF